MNKLVPLHTDTSKWAHPDELLIQIAEYVHDYKIEDPEIFECAKLSLLDSLGCGLMAIHDVYCQHLLGPVVPQTIVPYGSRVPGISLEMDPVQAAFNIGILIRWLDFNDTWLAAEWGHPSDNIGGILAVADCISQQRIARGEPPISMEEVLVTIIKAYEIQGILALNNSFNKVGIDHTFLVKLATAAVVSKLVGGGMDQTISALSNVFADGHGLRAFRHGSNTGPRKSWAAGDATSRGVWLAWLTAFGGEPGYPNVITTKQWGFSDVFFNGQPIEIVRPFSTYVIENVLFKVKYPAEFHGQTAVEVAIELSDSIKDRLDEIKKIKICTQEPAMRIINKTGELKNYADRDHCLQYMVAVALAYGDLQSMHYTDAFAADNKIIDTLRAKMEVEEIEYYTKSYYNLDERSVANGIQIIFNDGSKTQYKEQMYPLGHKKRREEAMGSLREKYCNAVWSCFSGEQQEAVSELWNTPEVLLRYLSIEQFMALWQKKKMTL